MEAVDFDDEEDDFFDEESGTCELCDPTWDDAEDEDDV